MKGSNPSEKIFLYKEESFAIRGALFEVYNQLGYGFLESVYQESLIIEFRQRDIPFVSQPKVEIEYKGVTLTNTFQPDFICFNKIIVELKAVKELASEHRAQVLNYLRVSRFRLGFLVNFGSSTKLIIERVIL
jgi:GxxExxY protein